VSASFKKLPRRGGYTSPVNRDYVIAGMDKLLTKPTIEIANTLTTSS
jgi:hypothetical protein